MSTGFGDIRPTPVSDASNKNVFDTTNAVFDEQWKLIPLSRQNNDALAFSCAAMMGLKSDYMYQLFNLNTRTVPRDNLFPQSLC